jgi:hypothetical protein
MPTLHPRRLFCRNLKLHKKNHAVVFIPAQQPTASLLRDEKKAGCFQPTYLNLLLLIGCFQPVMAAKTMLNHNTPEGFFPLCRFASTADSSCATLEG